MFVIFKNEDGDGWTIRPAYIGFIKNDTIRRSLCVIAMPFLIAATIFLSLLQAVGISLLILAKALVYPLSKLVYPWSDPIWREPRVKRNKSNNF